MDHPIHNWFFRLPTRIDLLGELVETLSELTEAHQSFIDSYDELISSAEQIRQDTTQNQHIFLHADYISLTENSRDVYFAHVHYMDTLHQVEISCRRLSQTIVDGDPVEAMTITTKIGEDFHRTSEANIDILNLLSQLYRNLSYSKFLGFPSTPTSLVDGLLTPSPRQDQQTLQTQFLTFFNHYADLYDQLTTVA